MTTEKTQHEQDYEVLAKLLNAAENSYADIIGVSGYYANVAFPALRRLHTEAAKVPGLESALRFAKDVLRDTGGAIADIVGHPRDNESGDALVESVRAKVAGLEADNAALVTLATDVLHTAMGLHAVYRTCATTESDGSHEAAFEAWHATLTATHSGAALLERLRTAESERDEWKSAYQKARDVQTELQSERDAARQEANTWVRDVVEPVRMALGLESTTSIPSAVIALRERVATLEAAIRAKGDDYRASHGEDEEGPHPMVDWADRLLRGTSQPPPAPTPPALVEAVRPLADVADVVLEMAVLQHRDDDHVVWAIRDGNGERTLTVGDFRRARAAYDAAKGGPGPDSTCPECGHVAHWSGHSYCIARNGLAGPCGCKHTPTAGGGK